MSDNTDDHSSEPEPETPTRSNHETLGIGTELSSSSASDQLSKVEATTQLRDRNTATNIGGGVEPPYPPAQLAALSELNETHAAAIRKKARWEVGHGFEIVPAVDSDNANEANHDDLEDFWFGSDSRWKIGPEGTTEATPSEVFELARQDYHSVGWACLEILTSNDGTPMGLAWVPAPTVRVRKARTRRDAVGAGDSNGDRDGSSDGHANREVVRGHGYVQSKAGKKRYFGEAGDRWRGRHDDDSRDPMFVDRETGDVGEEVDNPANELIFLPNPSPLDLYYGIPDWISGLRTIVGDYLAKEHNRDFFEHHALPYYAVMVNSGKLSDAARDGLRELFHDLKGENYRTAILEADGLTGDAESSIQLEPMGAQNDEDMQFTTYREWNEHEILKVHEVPPILVGNTEDANRANSKEQIQDFASDVIAPEQEKFAHRITEILHKKGFGIEDYAIEFHLRGANNDQQEAETAHERIEASQGVMRVNEVRDELDLPPIDEPIGEAMLFELQNGGGLNEAVDEAVTEQTEQAMSEYRIDSLLSDD